MHNSVEYICLFLFSTCFGHPRAHHQEKIAVSMRHWYLSLCMGGVWSAGWIEIQPELNRIVHLVGLIYDINGLSI